MLSAIRIVFAVVAVASLGAGTASARPLPINPGVAQCTPSEVKGKRFYGIRKIGARYYRVYQFYTIYTDRFCHRRMRATYLRLPLAGYAKR